MAENSKRPSKSRIRAYAFGGLLFIIIFMLAVAFTLPMETVLGLVTPSLEAKGISLEAENTRFVFPLGIRLENSAVSIRDSHPIPIYEATAAWEFSGLYKGLPSRLRIIHGQSLADIRLSAAFWNPGRGEATLEGISSDMLASVLSASKMKFSIRRIQTRWQGAGNDLNGAGSAEFDYLLFPVNLPGIQEVRIDNVSASFVAKGNTLHIHRMRGNFREAQIEGSGEIDRFISGDASVMLLLTLRNPFKGEVGMLFSMLAKNVNNAAIKISGKPGALKTEFIPL